MALMKSISTPDGSIKVGVNCQPDSKSNLPDKLSETTVRGVVMTKIILFLVFLLVLKGTIIFCAYLNGMATINSMQGAGGLLQMVNEVWSPTQHSWIEAVDQ